MGLGLHRFYVHPYIQAVPGEGNGNPLQYSCLENFMDRGAWQATAHGVTKSWTRLSTHAHSSSGLQTKCT